MKVSTGVSLVGFLLIVPSLLLQGYVLRHLWLWFIVPVLGPPVLTQAAATGIVLLARSLMVRSPPEPDRRYETDDEKAKRLIGSYLASFAMYGLFLLVGYCVSLFV